KEQLERVRHSCPEFSSVQCVQPFSEALRERSAKLGQRYLVPFVGHGYFERVTNDQDASPMFQRHDVLNVEGDRVVLKRTVCGILVIAELLRQPFDKLTCEIW